MPAVGPRPGNLLAGVAALILGAATLGGCVSTRDIEGLQQQLADVQRQMLQLQMVASSKEEVAGLEETLSQRTDALLRSEADMQVGIQELSTQIAQLQAQLEDTNYRLSQVSQQIAAGGSRGDGGRDVPVAPYGQPTPGAS